MKVRSDKTRHLVCGIILHIFEVCISCNEGWPGWVDLGGWLDRDKFPAPGVEPDIVTCPSTNRVQCRVTSLIWPTSLPTAPNRAVTVTLCGSRWYSCGDGWWLLHRHGQQPFLLMNVPCKDEECADYGRMFRVDQRLLSYSVNTTLSASFFDIGEDVRSGCCFCLCMCSEKLYKHYNILLWPLSGGSITAREMCQNTSPGVYIQPSGLLQCPALWHHFFPAHNCSFNCNNLISSQDAIKNTNMPSYVTFTLYDYIPVSRLVAVS